MRLHCRCLPGEETSHAAPSALCLWLTTPLQPSLHGRPNPDMWIREHAWERPGAWMLFAVALRGRYFCGSCAARSIDGQTPEDLLDWTTACVCSEVPEAIFVNAQAASNCKEGLQSKKKKKKTVTWVFHSDVTSTLVKHQQFKHFEFQKYSLVISFKTVH